MTRERAHMMARELMAQHGIGHWHFKFDRAVRRFGACSYRRQTIQLSAPLALVNDEAQVRDTILHEIAHALAGPMAGHGWMWKRKAQELGARPEACVGISSVRVPAQRWQATCPGCGHVSYRTRQPRMSRLNPGQIVEYTCSGCKRTKGQRIVVIWRHNTPADIARSNAQMVTQDQLTPGSDGV